MLCTRARTCVACVYVQGGGVSMGAGTNKRQIDGKQLLGMHGNKQVWGIGWRWYSRRHILHMAQRLHFLLLLR